MSRQVDVKALVSHIVRGDGADKCRICMGDTTDGQVYLSDTVMMDGDRAVSLSELLETITGVEVPLDDALPSVICPACSVSAQAAATFRDLCIQSDKQWHTAVQLLDNLPFDDTHNKKSIFAIICNDRMSIQEIEMDVEVNVKTEEISEFSDDEADIDLPKRPKKSTPMVRNCKCPDCGKSFAYPKDLHKHLMDSSDINRACFICAEIIPRDELVSHLKKVHNKRIHNCKKCPALLYSLKQYNKHMVKAHSPGAYSCGDCGRSFSTLHAFHGHSTMHQAQTCPGCDKLFRNRKCYTTHVKICCNLDKNRTDVHHTKHKVLIEVENVKENKKIKVGVRGSANKSCICDYCGKQFAGKKFVCAHIQIVHLKNTHRPCSYCGKSYAAAHMTEHLKKHEETQTFTCEHCGIVLKTKLGYIQHIRLHTGEKPYKCPHCSESFSASSRRSEHIRKFHKKAEDLVLKYACTFCTAKFRLPYKLKKHVSMVHSKQKKEYQCTTCHISFATCRGLLHHRNRHETFKISSIRLDSNSKNQ